MFCIFYPLRANTLNFHFSISIVLRYARFPRYARNDKRNIPKLLIINFSTNDRAVFDIDFVGFVGEGIFRASEYRLEAFRHFE